MPILVLPPRYTPDTIAISQAAQSAGWSVERLSSWRAPEWLIGQDIVLYGEPLFAAVVANDLRINLLEPPSDWLATLPTEYRLRNIEFSTLGEARHISRSMFVKPADDKCFLAGVFDSGLKLPNEDILPGATPVLIAEPVIWEVEFRSFVLERKLVAISPYLREGKLAISSDGSWSDDCLEQAKTYTEKVLSDFSVTLPPAIVLDVGIIRERGWAVIEVNAAWGSGIYGCDQERILPVLRRACIPSDCVSSEDRQWMVQRDFS